MNKKELIKSVTEKVNYGDFLQIEDLIYPLVDIYLSENDHQEALNSLNLLNEVLINRGYLVQEKIKLEEKKIEVFQALGEEREVLISMKIIAETLKPFDGTKFVEKVKECLVHYENMEQQEPGDKEYLQSILLEYYKEYGFHKEAAQMIKDIIKHKAIHQIPVTLSEYHDCLYYADNEKTKEIICDNIRYMLENKSYEIGITEIIAMKDLIMLCQHFQLDELKHMLLNEIEEITSREEYSFYKQFIS